MVLSPFETLLALRVISVPAVNKPMVSSNVFPAFAITAEEIPRFFAISAELTANEFDTSLLLYYYDSLIHNRLNNLFIFITLHI